MDFVNTCILIGYKGEVVYGQSCMYPGSQVECRIGLSSDDRKLVFDFSEEKGRVTCFVEKPY